MKKSGNYIFRKVAGEYILIPSGETALRVKGLIRLSESGGFLYEKLIRESCSEEELVRALTEEYEGLDKSTAREDVAAFLKQMRDFEIISEE